MKISQERVEQILPQNIKDTTLLTENAKNVLAVLMHCLLVSKGAEESGFLIKGNKELRELLQMNRDYMMDALRELEEYDLIKRVQGKTRKQGEKAQASEYHFNWDNIFDKPLKKKTSEELFQRFRKSSGIPSGTTTTITTSIPITTSTKTSTTTSIKTETKMQTETATINNKYFEEFKENVNKRLVGSNENELLERRIELSNELSSKGIQFGQSLQARCASYLKRMYEEAIASM
jgi:DNA-binding GntR family transcriptional regulator